MTKQILRYLYDLVYHHLFLQLKQRCFLAVNFIEKTCKKCPWISSRVTIDVLLLILVFILPFQSRIYKFLRPLSRSWIDSNWQLPSFFQPFAEIFISDVLLIALGIWALWQRKFQFHLSLTVVLGVALVSILMSDYPTYPLSYWRWAHLVLPASLLYFFKGWAHSFKTIAFVIFITGVLECTVVIPQYLVQHELGLKFLGEPVLVDHNYIAPHFDMPQKSLTLIDYIFNPSPTPGKVMRATGTFPHANILGGFLVFSLLFTGFVYESSLYKRWIGVGLILQIVALFMTYSRSALFAFAGAVVTWLFLFFLKEKKMSTLWKPLCIGMASSFLLFSPQIFYRGGVVTYNEIVAQSDGMRVSMQNVALQMITDHPWLGVGFNHYLIYLAKYVKDSSVDSISVHNIYFLLAAEMGLIGVAVFLMFSLSLMVRAWRHRTSLEACTTLVVLTALFMIGWVDFYPLLNQQMLIIFFLTAGLLMGHSYNTQLSKTMAIKTSQNPGVLARFYDYYSF